MFQYLQSLFKKNKKSNNDNTLTIVCDHNKNNKIHVNFNKTSPESAQQFAEMLFLLNEGYYTKLILEILQEISKTDTDQTNFINDVISRWSSFVLEVENYEQDQLNSPIVAPTYFYKSAK